ncbi:DUF3822 family protein [Belliella sp. DSM 107340]|uniref:DUF3822 family protein n=1 Tax=Belliella calami TaxID=2923436 RepID=A0ABS9ULJ3_9BACT|nr:DUF3822 family protein [Belliella calami]MCH7397239.1 DUF3822 family protein [Belliella calami]
MADSVENIQENIYSDKFDTSSVSSLSLFLFDEKYILLAKDVNNQVSAIHQKFFSDLKSLQFVLERDKLFAIAVPTKIFLFHKSYALIPGVIFEANHVDLYLDFSDKSSQEISFLYSSLDSNNIYVVSKIENNLKSTFEINKTKITYHHGSCSFLSYALANKNSYLNQEVLISVFGQNFYIAAFKNQELASFNVFETENKEGLMKYLFGVTHQLDFDRKYCRISLMGEYSQMGIDQEFGNTYYKNFVLTQPTPNQQYLEGAEIFKNSNFFEGFWEF